MQPHDSPAPAIRYLSPKLLHRFYEPLGLLFALGTARGEHTHRSLSLPEQVDSLTALDLRRQFLDELAFLCDYKKGGDAVTAIGLAQTPQGSVFWVAANKCPENKIIPFLVTLLQLLKDAHGQREGQLLTKDIFNLSVNFAKARIKTYAKFLSSDLDRLGEFTICTDPAISGPIAAWKEILDIFVEQDLCALVEFAYENRHSNFVRRLATLANERDYKMSGDSLQAACMSARHHIGRLGLHSRSARALALYMPRAMTFLDSYRVQAVPIPSEGNARPPIRNQTTVEAALGRMLPSGDSNLEMYRRALAQMDGTFNISERFRKDFSDAKNRTRVHAEVQILHHFDRNNEEFAGSDKYIACSKPACFCCLLYFRHHPGGYVEPRSHHKIYLNWQPPGVFDAPRPGEKNKLRDILNLMIQDIREDALRQIIEKAGPRRFHPDSTTGISASVLAAPDLDAISTTADHGRTIREVSSSSSGYSSFESDNAAASSSPAVEPSVDSDTDEEEGGISLL